LRFEFQRHGSGLEKQPERLPAGEPPRKIAGPAIWVAYFYQAEKALRMTYLACGVMGGW
jgi:hypothetical protein